MASSLPGFVKMNCSHKFRPSSSSYLLALLIVFHFNPVATAILPNFIWNLCPTDANYTGNSAFHTNLNLLLSSLSSSTTAATGFHNDTIGRPPDQAFGLALCRGDLSLSDCQGCLNASVTQIIDSCPTGVSSTIWYDICMLRYSNTNFFSADTISVKVYQRNSNNASDPQIFNDKLGNLMNSLATKAAKNSTKLFAAGDVNMMSSTKIYGLVQCTRDLSAGDCYNCLLDAVGSVPTFCDGKQGCKVLGQNCCIRYEIYPFYNISAAEEISPSSSTPVSPGPLRLTCTGSTEANNIANSEYHNNLNLLLSSLSSSTAAAAGFLKDTIGQPPNQVYGLALCRGDLSLGACQGCLNASVAQITDSCHTSMNSTVWYDLCMLRYSNKNFFSAVDINSYEVYINNPNNASDPMALVFHLGILMNRLVTKAARSSPKMFAVDTVRLTSSTNIYGLEQCTRDLSTDGCYDCLLHAVEIIANSSRGSQGFWVLGQSCSVRYEIYPFYNISYATEIASPPPSSNPVSPPTGNEGKNNSTGRRILLSVISIAATLLFLCAIFIYRRRTKATPRRRKLLTAKFNHKDQYEIRGAKSLLFDLETIRIATDNFSDRNKLGEGGFGSVYKGTLENGEHVAVKRLSRSSGQGLDELKNEVFLVAKLRHRNLVRLLGCCLESEEKLLVYNYLANTSLDKYLFDNSKREQLDWARRLKIIEGISRGLLYLHEDSPLKIIHRDLKASNILLDANMNPKISDFGLAKLFGVDETQGNTNRIAGTFGYMAPEYALHGLFSVKSDVYSYGVLILEILTSQRNSGYRGSEYPIELVTHLVWRHWTQGNALQVIDQELVEQSQGHQILRCIHIGLLCVQEDPIQRPTMSNVVLMLNSQFVNLPTPSAPAFLSNTTSASNDIPRRENSSGSQGIRMKISENNVTISALEPR